MSGNAQASALHCLEQSGSGWGTPMLAALAAA